MRKTIQDWIEQYRHMDWAVLYMRLFAGGIMLFHNIGKVQDYNEIISSYPSLLYIDNTATFVIISVAEVLLATMIIIGSWVRFSALMMSLGIVLVFAWGGFQIDAEEFTWLGIYVFLVISGGGYYSFDAVMKPRSKRKSRQTGQ